MAPRCLRKLVHPLFCFLPTSYMHLPSALGALECSVGGSNVHLMFLTTGPQNNGQIISVRKVLHAPWPSPSVMVPGRWETPRHLCFAHIVPLFQNTIPLLSYLVKSLHLFKSSVCMSPFPGKLLGIFLSWFLYLSFIIFSAPVTCVPITCCSYFIVYFVFYYVCFHM